MIETKEIEQVVTEKPNLSPSEASEVSTQYNEESKRLEIKLFSKKYSLDVNNPKAIDFLESIDAYNILDNISALSSSLDTCNSIEIKELDDIAKFAVYSPLEYYLDMLSLKIEDLVSDIGVSLFSFYQCTICLCEFYDDIFKFDLEKMKSFQNDKDADFGVSLIHCGGHSFHKECINSYLKSQLDHQSYFKCPVCSLIYGNYIGDQTEGTMSIVYNEKINCDGYEGTGTYVIDYSMKGGNRGEISYPPTHRTGYIPATNEGKEVLKLLKLAFKKKQIFTIGDSVTTGRKNVIVWNGIHHKTNTSGGSAYFGYPDPTYFDRIKLELALKGIYTEDISTGEIRKKEKIHVK